MCADLTDSQLDAWKKRVSLGRIGTADEVAHVITMVATSSFMTGSVVSVDGGVE